MKEKDYISQAHVENWEQTSAINNSKVIQHQHIEPPPQQEKTRTLIDTHNTAKASNVHFRDSKVPLQVLDTNKLDRKLLERPEKRKLAQQQTQYQKGTSRLSGEELFQWQQSWKKIMRESVVFLKEHTISNCLNTKSSQVSQVRWFRDCPILSHKCHYNNIEAYLR